MKKVYYLNINYTCNNQCEFCLSHNTKDNIGTNIKLKDIQALKINYKNSRVVINGGEPTLVSNLDEYIKYFKCGGAEVVLYTNGRMFSDYEFCKKILQSNLDRVTIPIHGTKEIHNKVTNAKSFDETIEGINNISTLKSLYNCALEIKFILNNDIVEKYRDLIEFIPKGLNHKQIDFFVISNVIDTDYYEGNTDKRKYDLVKTFLRQKSDIPIKIEDFPLCKILQTEKIGILQTEWFDEFYFLDYKCSKFKKIDYTKITECKQRTKREPCKHCNSIMDNYYVVCKKKDSWYYCME